MSEPKIAREVAEKTVAGWEATAEVALTIASRDKLVRMVTAGRLDYAGGKFRYYLLEPLPLKNGETIDYLEIAEPSGQALLDADVESRTFASTCKLIGLLSDHPGIAERFGQRDLLNLSEVVAFFGQ